MIPKQFRLKKMKDIEILMKEGRFFGGKFVTAKMWKIDPKKYPKRNYTGDDLLIGFTAGKKISKLAVKRNTYKRKMREVVRLLLKENKVNKGVMMMFIAKPQIKDATFVDIQKDILDLIKKMRVYVK